MTLNHLTHCAENIVSLNPQPFKTKNGKKDGDRWWCSALMIPCCTSCRVTAEIEKWQFQVNLFSGCVLLNALGCTPHEHQARRLSIGFIMLMRAQQRYLYLLTCVFSAQIRLRDRSQTAAIKKFTSTIKWTIVKRNIIFFTFCEFSLCWVISVKCQCNWKLNPNPTSICNPHVTRHFIFESDLNAVKREMKPGARKRKK